MIYGRDAWPMRSVTSRWYINFGVAVLLLRGILMVYLWLFPAEVFHTLTNRSGRCRMYMTRNGSAKAVDAFFV